MEPTDTTPEKKKRGRPPLPPELKKPKKQGISGRKEGGYASQKKYKETHPEKNKEWCKNRRKKYYMPTLLIPIEHRDELKELMNSQGMTLSDFFLDAVETKYDIVLRK